MDQTQEKTTQLNRVLLERSQKKTRLSQTVNELMATDEVKRIKNYARLFEAFHLKNTITSEVDGRWVCVNGQRVSNFASANYLGFDQHPNLVQQGQEALKRWGTHTGSSRIFTSHENLVHLEAELAELVGAEKTLVGVNVSMTHQMVIPTLFGNSGVKLLVDRYAHTSIYQACLTAKAKGAKVVSVDVADLDDLRRHLQPSLEYPVLLVDGIYSMQGHFPDFSKLSELCEQAQGILYVDDAHGIGVYGARGGGVAEEFQLSFDNMILIGSLQKGLAAFGGFVAGSASLIDLIRVSSKPYIFSGPLQPAMVEQGRAAVALCQSAEGQNLRQRLRQLSTEIRSRLRSIGWAVPDGDSPIVAVPIGEEVTTLMAGRFAFDRGVYLNSVLYPAVPRNQGILRVSLSSLHSNDQIDQLVHVLSELRSYVLRPGGRLHFGIHAVKEVLKAKWQGESYAGL